MNNAAVGTSVGGAGRPARMLALSAVVLVAVVLTLTAVLFMASPPVRRTLRGRVDQLRTQPLSGGRRRRALRRGVDQLRTLGTHRAKPAWWLTSQGRSTSGEGPGLLRVPALLLAPIHPSA